MVLFYFKGTKVSKWSHPKWTTNNGYWKATGVDKEIWENGILRGLKKTLVFYRGEPQRGDKTKWIMHEYRLVDAPIPTKRSANDMKVCRCHPLLLVFILLKCCLNSFLSFCWSNTTIEFCVNQLDDCVLCKIYNTNNRKSSEQDEDHSIVVSDINPTTQLPNIDPTKQMPQALKTEIISPGLSLQGRETIMNDLRKLKEEQLKEKNPPGFRFNPTDRELVKYYLKPRVLNKPRPKLSFMEVDLYNQNPYTLVGFYSLNIPFFFLVFCWLFWIEWKLIIFNAIVWYIYIYIYNWFESEWKSQTVWHIM